MQYRLIGDYFNNFFLSLDYDNFDFPPIKFEIIQGTIINYLYSITQCSINMSVTCNICIIALSAFSSKRHFFITSDSFALAVCIPRKKL